MTDDSQNIKCVILTMRRENVILPGVNIAEIISVKSVDTTGERPRWYLGDIQWRGQTIPLLSFEAAGGEAVSSVNLNTQAVVLHTAADASTGDTPPFVALVMSGVPHVTRFSRRQIVSDGEAEVDHPMVAQKVRINGARISILDIDGIVTMLTEAAPASTFKKYL